MATINSAQSGNFTDTATWVGGVVPTSGDVATVVSTHVVTINSSITCTELTNANTAGYFNLTGGATVNANITGGATKANNGVVVASAGDNTINGNLTGMPGTANFSQVILTGTGTLTINGNIVRTNTANVTGANQVYSNTANTKLTLNGDATSMGSSTSANDCSAVLFTSNASNATLNITGTVKGSRASAVNTTPSSGVDVRGANSTLTFSGTSTTSTDGTSTTQSPGIHFASSGGTLTATGTFTSDKNSSTSNPYDSLIIKNNPASVTVQGNFSAYGTALVDIGSGTGTLTVTNAAVLDTNTSSGSTSFFSFIVSTGSLTFNASNGIKGIAATAFTETNVPSNIIVPSPLLIRTEITSNGSITLNTNITGDGRPALYVHTTGTGLVTVNGNVTGGNTVYTNTSPAIIIGDKALLKLVGNATGGQAAAAVAGTGGLIFDGEDIASVQGYRGLAVGRLFVDDPLTFQTNYTVYNGLTSGAPNNGTVNTLVDDTVLDDLLETDVRSGVSYAYNTRTGTLAVPAPEQVSYGVPVDATVGTATLSLTDVTDAIDAAKLDVTDAIDSSTSDVTDAIDDAVINIGTVTGTQITTAFGTVTP